ncbi:terpene synthase family protein [Streptomyces sp. NBC_00656]|uniref:terpene synthase family protein n=1 Tax=Streptomyces sp. NBC_00656 TaxID=2903668 RepID=UPI00324DCDD8
MTVSPAAVSAFPFGTIKLYCPVPLQEHPLGAGTLDSQGAEWCVRQGLCEPGSFSTRMNLGLLTATGMPYLTDQAAEAFCLYSYWAFLWDDHLDALAKDFGKAVLHITECAWAVREPDDPAMPDNKWLAALREVMRMMEACATPADARTLRVMNTFWLGATTWRLALQEQGVRPTLGEYLRMRVTKSGLDVLAFFTGTGAGYPLTPEELADPAVRAFSETVGSACSFFNDLLSMFKEAALGQAGINILSLIGGDEDIDPLAALERVWELYERIVCLTMRLQRQLLADPRANVARFAAELPAWLPATLHFTTTSARYLELPGTDGTPLAPPELVMTSTPNRWDPDDLTPPPIPEIAWWWQQLTP